MLKTKSVTKNLLKSSELNQQWQKTLIISSRQTGWNGILVEQYQSPSTSCEVQLPAMSDHWLCLPLGQPIPLIQKYDNRFYESIVQKGDSIFIPAGQSSYWYRREGDICNALHIHLKPELLGQTTEAYEIDTERFDLVKRFVKQDLQLHHIAMLLSAELHSGGMMGRLYVESLTQILVIHFLRHYSTLTQSITSQNSSLTRNQLQRTIDYIHAHLDQDLSLVQIAGVINISPTYFASLFKRATGISPHQYVIQQRVERAKRLLLKSNLSISDIALQVGFSSQSHLTQQFKRLTGVTPKQFAAVQCLELVAHQTYASIRG